MIRQVLRAVDRSPLLVLLGLIVIAASARFILALGNPTPWIFTDEFIYSELSRSLADRGDLLIRDDRIYYSTITPLINAPGYLLGGTAVAYDWIKGANAVVMASAALPAYGLARMALSKRLSLVFATLVLALPAFAYVGVVMTEPAFLPLALLFVWMLARAIQNPTIGRQALVIAVVALAVLTRLQGVVLLVAIPAAIAYVLLRGDGERAWREAFTARLRGLWPLVALTVGLPILALLAQAVRSRDERGLLGGYREVETGVSTESFIDWSTWHIAVIALAVGLVPFALAVATWGKFLFSPFRDRGVDAALIATLALTVPLLVQVVVFAINHSDRVQERNLFYVEPLVILVALIGVAVYGMSRIVAVAASGLTALAVIDLPVDELLTPPPFSDTFALLSLLKLSEWLTLSVSTTALILALAGIAGTAVVAFLPRRAAIATLAGGTLVALVVGNLGVTPRLNDFAAATAASVAPEPREWVDSAAGDEDVAFLWNSADDPKLVWESEFWNESIRSVVAVPGELPAIGVPRADIDPATGAFVPLRPGIDELPPESLVVTSDSWELVGEPVASARAQAATLVLWRIEGPPRLAGNASGLYQDGWTEPVIELRRFACEGGVFELPIGRGHGARQRLRISPSGGPERVEVLRRPAIEPLRIEVQPEAGTDVCTARVEVLDVATGAELGNPVDPRVLGARAAAPEFVPST